MISHINDFQNLSKQDITAIMLFKIFPRNLRSHFIIHYHITCLALANFLGLCSYTTYSATDIYSLSSDTDMDKPQPSTYRNIKQRKSRYLWAFLLPVWHPFGEASINHWRSQWQDHIKVKISMVRTLIGTSRSVPKETFSFVHILHNWSIWKLEAVLWPLDELIPVSVSSFECRSYDTHDDSHEFL